MELWLPDPCDVRRRLGARAGLGFQSEGLDLLGDARRTGFPLEGGPWSPGSGKPKRPPYCGYRTHRWMYAEYASGDRELYDYRNDPQELTDVAYQRAYRPTVRRLRNLAQQTCRPVPPQFAWSEGSGAAPKGRPSS